MLWRLGCHTVSFMLKRIHLISEEHRNDSFLELLVLEQVHEGIDAAVRVAGNETDVEASWLVSKPGILHRRIAVDRNRSRLVIKRRCLMLKPSP